MKQTIDQLIETGHSEQIFSHAIQGYGRGQVRTNVILQTLWKKRWYKLEKLPVETVCGIDNSLSNEVSFGNVIRKMSFRISGNSE